MKPNYELSTSSCEFRNMFGSYILILFKFGPNVGSRTRLEGVNRRFKTKIKNIREI